MKKNIASLEHFPIVEIDESGNGAGIIFEIVLGKENHPSDKEHFISKIVLLDGKNVLGSVSLTHYTKPRVTFFLKDYPENPVVKVYCNKEGVFRFKIYKKEEIKL